MTLFIFSLILCPKQWNNGYIIPLNKLKILCISYMIVLLKLPDLYQRIMQYLQTTEMSVFTRQSAVCTGLNLQSNCYGCRLFKSFYNYVVGFFCDCMRGLLNGRRTNYFIFFFRYLEECRVICHKVRQLTMLSQQVLQQVTTSFLYQVLYQHDVTEHTHSKLF